MTIYLFFMLFMNVVGVLVLARLRPGHVNKPWTQFELTLALGMRMALAVWTVLLLAGCGGGGDDGPDQTVPPAPNCALQPIECR